MTDRPRDRLGRPLPRDADPTDAAEPVPDVSGLTDEQAWDLGLDYLNRGLPFHAHEVFEQRWRTSADVHRGAWQALAQWGAALTHVARGNEVGARRVAERALRTLAGAEGLPAGIDVARVRASCRALIR